MKNIQFINHILILAFVLLIAGCTLDDPTEDQMSQFDQSALDQYKLDQMLNPKYSESEVLGPTALELKDDELDLYKASRQKYKDLLNSNLSAVTGARTSGTNSIELYPTGNSLDDFINIQAILDESGEMGMDLELRLKSTNIDGLPTKFNLTNRQIVLKGEQNGQTGKVKLVGEHSKGFMTTLKGGAEFFRLGVLERRLLLALAREQIKIEKIAFENGHITTAGGGNQPLPGTVIIKDSHFSNNTGLIASITTFGTAKKLLIKDCHFDNNKLGIWVLLDHPDAVISNNVIANASGGISIGNNASGKFSVYNNVIASTPLAPGGNSYWEMGILVRTVQDTEVDIFKNEIMVDGPSKTGISVVGFSGNMGDPDPITDISIYDNDIQMNSDIFAAIDITAFAIDIEGVCVSENEISGSSGLAFSASSLSGKKVRNINYVDNDIDHFTPSCAIGQSRSTAGCAFVWFGSGTSDLRYCGDIPGNTIDTGVNNLFSDDDDCKECGDDY